MNYMKIKCNDTTNFFLLFDTQRGATDYLCNISNKKKIIYMSVPKVGCSTIIYSLQKAENKKFFIKNIIEEIKKIFDEYFVFSFVRNPFTRCLSCYLEKFLYDENEKKRLLPLLGYNNDENISFSEFLFSISKIKDNERDIHFSTQSTLLSIKNVKYDFIGRFEYFSTGLKALSSIINIDFSTSINNHATKLKNKLTEYYNPENIQLVLSIYKNDFMNFCYSTDIRFALV